MDFHKFLFRHPHTIILGLLILLFCVYYTYASFLRYDNFYTGRYDLGNMTQTVWNTEHGRIFQFTDPESDRNISRLAYHADVILILLSPLYRIWEDPRMLLLVQTVTVALGAVFVYLIAKKILQSNHLSLAFAFAFLINPAVGWTVLFDFHPVALATTLLLGASYFLITKRYGWFIAFAVLAALTKEQVWLIVALMGLLLVIFQNKNVLGGAVFIFSLCLFYTLLWHLIPQAASTKGHFALSYFQDGGSNPSELMRHSLMHPWDTIHKLVSFERAEYIRSLLMPVGFLPLFFPFWLFLPGADFALNLLSDKPELHQIYYHYTATITPFLFLSAVYATRYIRKYAPVFSLSALSFTVFAYAVFGAYHYGPLPYTRQPNDEMIFAQVPHKEELHRALQEIPRDKSVASSNEIGAQLSHREKIYTLGIDVRVADYVAFYTHDRNPEEVEENSELMAQMRHDTDYALWYHKHGMTIFKRTKN